MNNTVVLKDRAYVEKKQSKKTWMDRVKKYFQENRETIIAGLLSMNGDVNAYRMLEWNIQLANNAPGSRETYGVF